MTGPKREVVLTTPEGDVLTWARLRPGADETQTLLRARDWARKMYGQTSPVVETVRVEVKP